MRFVFSGVLLLNVVLAQSTGLNEGTMVVLRCTAGGHTTEFTTYTLKDRRRAEYRSPAPNTDVSVPGSPIYMGRSANVSIQRCDLGQNFDLATATEQCSVSAYPPKWLVRQGVLQGWSAQLPAPSVDDTAVPTVGVEIATVDTGERAEFFGHIARHVVTTVRQIRDKRWNGILEESITDGWYIDFDPWISCEPKPQTRFRLVDGCMSSGGITMCAPRPEIVEIGAQELGFAVREVRTPMNKAFWGSTYEIEVMQLLEAPLVPALFQVPAGFKHVQRLQ